MPRPLSSRGGRRRVVPAAARESGARSDVKCLNVHALEDSLAVPWNSPSLFRGIIESQIDAGAVGRQPFLVGEQTDIGSKLGQAVA